MASFALLSRLRPKARRLTRLKSFPRQGREQLRHLPQRQYGSKLAAPRHLRIRWARFGSLIKALREAWPAVRESPLVVHAVVVISLVRQVVLEVVREVVRERPMLRRLRSTSRVSASTCN